jgi:rhodanese-related sulfurtransferase
MAGNAQALAAIQTLLGQSALPPHSTWVFDATRWESKILRWKPKADCGCRRGGGDWSWLAEAEPRKEVGWIDLGPEDRQVVVDVRESREIRSEEWEWFASQGSRVVHHPLSGWNENPPRWEDGTSYLIVCAHGTRSLAALKTVPDGIRALSLTGGVAHLRRT